MSSKKFKPTKQTFWCTKNLQGIVWNSGRFDYSELPNVLPRYAKADFFKRTKKYQFRRSLMDKEVESLDDHGCPKVPDLVDEEM